MPNDDNLIEIALPSIQMDEILKPSDRPVVGNQRLVRFLPAIPGMNELFPCIWMSPYTTYELIDEQGTMAKLVTCLILISKGPPKPEVVPIRIQPEKLTLFPLMPVEW
jgi:hypothetical protein